MYSRPDARPGKHDQYYCKSQFPSGVGCGSPRMWRERLDFSIRSFVSEYFTKREALSSLLESLNSAPRLNSVTADIEKGKTELERLKAEKRRLLTLAIKSHFDDSQIEAESARIDSEAQSWGVFLGQAERQRESLSVADAKSVAGLLASTFAEFEFLGINERRKLLRQFLAKVYVRDGSIVKLAMRLPSSGTNL
jgi:hypothetical protein